MSAITFTPPRPEFFLSDEDRPLFEALRHADRQLAHAEQELRGAMKIHEEARKRHIAAETAFANAPSGRAYHVSYVEILQKHQAAVAEAEKLAASVEVAPPNPA